MSSKTGLCGTVWSSTATFLPTCPAPLSPALKPKAPESNPHSRTLLLKPPCGLLSPPHSDYPLGLTLMQVAAKERNYSTAFLARATAIPPNSTTSTPLPPPAAPNPLIEQRKCFFNKMEIFLRSDGLLMGVFYSRLFVVSCRGRLSQSYPPTAPIENRHDRRHTHQRNAF